jgi:hypothetical protein
MEKWDGETIPVKPQNVELIKNKLATGEGFINTKTRSIAVKDIKDFRETSKPYSDQKLLESGIQAFGLPEINPDGSIQAKWVKKPVNRREFAKLYSGPGYRVLSEADNHTWVAFRLPLHVIDYNKVYDCNAMEIQRLEGTA